MARSLLLFRGVLCGAVLLTRAAAAFGDPATPAVKFLVSKGTPVVVATVKGIDSKTAYVDDPIAYTVTNDVIVNGAVVARAGDYAAGVVLDAVNGRKVRAGTAGMLLGPVGAVAGSAVNKSASKGSNLRVSVNRVRTFCGSTINLTFVRSEYHKPKKLAKMTPVVIVQGQKYEALVAKDQNVCGRPTSATPAPIPNGVLQADKPPG